LKDWDLFIRDQGKTHLSIEDDLDIECHNSDYSFDLDLEDDPLSEEELVNY
jgi:hypothetical protein